MRPYVVLLAVLAALVSPASAQSIVTLSSLTNSGSIATSPGTGNVALGGTISSSLTLAGAYGTGAFTVTGGWSGTIVPEGQSCDAAGTWTTLQVFPVGSTTGQTSITANGVYTAAISGFCAIRGRGNSVATAAATVTLTASSSGGSGSGGGGAAGAVTVADGADVTLGAKADAVCGSSTGTCSLEALIKYLNTQAALIVTNTGAAIPAGTFQIGNVGVLPPAGSTSTNGTNTGTTTSITTTLAADAAKTEYVCAISVRANATAAATVNATLSDGTKTLNYTMWVAPTASGLGVVEQIYNPCIPATAINTAWTLTSGAPGTGGVVSVSITGFKL